MARNPIPGPPGLPFAGPVIPYLRDPIKFMIDNHRRYGEIVRVDLLGLKGAAFHGPEANKFILADAPENFLVAPFIDRVGARWLVGHGLLFIDDPEHRLHRRLIMPAFSRKRIESYQQVMREATAQLLGRWTPGAEIDVSAEMHRVALTIVGRTLFSKDLAGEAHNLGEAVAAIVQSISNPVTLWLAHLPFDVPPMGVGGRLRVGMQRIDRVLLEIIRRHEREHDDAGDVVSMLVAARDEDGGRLTERQVRDHLLTLFFAGHETSANALAWTFYLLAQHPQVTTKLLDELREQLGGEPPSADDLNGLTYLDQVVKESLRLYPPVASVNRIAKSAFKWKGYAIKAGDLVSYVPFVSHRMAEYFPEPDSFVPERFAPEQADRIPPYAYIPFGAGPRSCVGGPFAIMEIKTVLAMILQRFRLDLVPNQRIVATVRVTVQPKRGIRMRLHPQDGRTERSPARVFGNILGAES